MDAMNIELSTHVGHVQLKILKFYYLIPSYQDIKHQHPMADCLLSMQDVREWKKLFELNLFIFCCAKFEIKLFWPNRLVDLFDLFHFVSLFI